jgi:hypothetical protein
MVELLKMREDILAFKCKGHDGVKVCMTIIDLRSREILYDVSCFAYVCRLRRVQYRVFFGRDTRHGSSCDFEDRWSGN